MLALTDEASRLLVGVVGQISIDAAKARADRTPKELRTHTLWFMAIIVLLFIFLVGRTRYFRQAYYIGGNARAAKLSGINVDRTVFSFFVIMGLLSGLAGALLASRLNTAVVLAGQGVELKVITAVVLGGASLSGGVGTIVGAFLGVLLMALLQNAMIIAGISPFYQLIVVGMVLLLSVGLDQLARARGRA